MGLYRVAMGRLWGCMGRLWGCGPPSTFEPQEAQGRVGPCGGGRETGEGRGLARGRGYKGEGPNGAGDQWGGA